MVFQADMLVTERVGEQNPDMWHETCWWHLDEKWGLKSAARDLLSSKLRSIISSLAQQELRDAARKEEAGGTVEAAPAQTLADAEPAELRQGAGTWAGRRGRTDGPGHLTIRGLSKRKAWTSTTVPLFCNASLTLLLGGERSSGVFPSAFRLQRSAPKSSRRSTMSAPPLWAAAWRGASCPQPVSTSAPERCTQWNAASGKASSPPSRIHFIYFTLHLFVHTEWV